MAIESDSSSQIGLRPSPRKVRETPGLVLAMLDKDCRTAGTHWAIVGSPFVGRLLHIGDPSDALPMASSERQGLNAVAAQRQARLAAS